MTCKQRDGLGRRGYHHGNLRAALIDSAIELIKSKGVAAFTLAETARLAGVSPAAPYRHFEDRDDLLAEIAKQGFELLAAALRQSWANATPDATEGLNNIGLAYLSFSRDQPAYYVAMFEAGLPSNATPELEIAAAAAFEVVLTAAKALPNWDEAKDRAPASMVAMHVWALCHGIASLFAKADNTSLGSAIPASELLEAGIRLYLRGLESMALSGS